MDKTFSQIVCFPVTYLLIRNSHLFKQCGKFFESENFKTLNICAEFGECRLKVKGCCYECVKNKTLHSVVKPIWWFVFHDLNVGARFGYTSHGATWAVWVGKVLKQAKTSCHNSSLSGNQKFSFVCCYRKYAPFHYVVAPTTYPMSNRSKSPWCAQFFGMRLWFHWCVWFNLHLEIEKTSILWRNTKRWIWNSVTLAKITHVSNFKCQLVYGIKINPFFHILYKCKKK